MKLQIYSLPTGKCPKCDALIALLDQYNIQYDKLELGRDFTSTQFTKRFGYGEGFPAVLDENGTHIEKVREAIQFLMDKAKNR